MQAERNTCARQFTLDWIGNEHFSPKPPVYTDNGGMNKHTGRLHFWSTLNILWMEGVGCKLKWDAKIVGMGCAEKG